MVKNPYKGGGSDDPKYHWNEFEGTATFGPDDN